MNYSSIYHRLIESSKVKVRLETEYYEQHHIIPRCMGGSDDANNIAILTAREHYIAHLLLCKIYPSNINLILAAMMMCVDNDVRGEHRNKNRLYEWVRKNFSKNHPSKTYEGKEKIKQGLAAYYNSAEWEKKKISMKVKIYEIRSCLCGCGQTFEVSKKSKRKYLNNKHHRSTQISSELTKRKQSESVKKYISLLSEEEKTDRLSKSFGKTDTIKRGLAISSSKKGKQTNQQEIMGRKYASMSDQEFDIFINSKSSMMRERFIKLREKWKLLID